MLAPDVKPSLGKRQPVLSLHGQLDWVRTLFPGGLTVKTVRARQLAGNFTDKRSLCRNKARWPDQVVRCGGGFKEGAAQHVV